MADAIISSEPGPAMKLQNLKYVFPNESSKIKLFVLSVILPYLTDKFQDFLSYNNWGKHPDVRLTFVKIMKSFLKCLFFAHSKKDKEVMKYVIYQLYQKLQTFYKIVYYLNFLSFINQKGGLLSFNRTISEHLLGISLTKNNNKLERNMDFTYINR